MFFASTSTKLNLSLFLVFNFSDIKKKKKKKKVVQLKRTTSQTLKGSKFERKTKSLFKSKFGNKGHICVVVAVAVLVAKGPY